MKTILWEDLSHDQSEIVSRAMIAARHQGDGSPRSISWVQSWSITGSGGGDVRLDLESLGAVFTLLSPTAR